MPGAHEARGRGPIPGPGSLPLVHQRDTGDGLGPRHAVEERGEGLRSPGRPADMPGSDTVTNLLLPIRRKAVGRRSGDQPRRPGRVGIRDPGFEEGKSNQQLEESSTRQSMSPRERISRKQVRHSLNGTVVAYLSHHGATSCIT